MDQRDRAVRGELFPAAAGIQMVAASVLVILSVAFAIRIAILLPAIAVDASGATVSNALADTRDRNWFILKAFFVTFVPTLLMLLLLLGILAAFGSTGLLAGLFDLVGLLLAGPGRRGRVCDLCRDRRDGSTAVRMDW